MKSHAMIRASNLSAERDSGSKGRCVSGERRATRDDARNGDRFAKTGNDSRRRVGPWSLCQRDTKRDRVMFGSELAGRAIELMVRKVGCTVARKVCAWVFATGNRSRNDILVGFTMVVKGRDDDCRQRVPECEPKPFRFHQDIPRFLKDRAWLRPNHHRLMIRKLSRRASPKRRDINEATPRARLTAPAGSLLKVITLNFSQLRSA